MWAFGDDFGREAQLHAGEGNADSAPSPPSLFALVAQPAAAASSPPNLLSLEQQLNSMVAGKLRRRGPPRLPPTPRDRQYQRQHALPDGEHGQGGGRRALSCAGRQRAAFARRHPQRPAARGLMRRMLVHSDNRATDILLADLARGPRLAAGQRDQGAPCSGPEHFRTAAQQARPVGSLGFWTMLVAMVDLLKRLYKAEPASKFAEPQLPARPHGPVPDGQEPDEQPCFRQGHRSLEHKTGTLDGSRR